MGLKRWLHLTRFKRALKKECAAKKVRSVDEIMLKIQAMEIDALHQEASPEAPITDNAKMIRAQIWALQWVIGVE